jgi:DNA-binding transcriptional LysR family regulator
LADRACAQFGALKSRLIALNVHDAVLRLTEGGCDLLIAYHHPSQPLQLSPDRYEMLSLGAESLAPYAKPDPDGQPLFRLPGRPVRACPSWLRARRLHGAAGRGDPQAGRAAALDTVYETDMAEGLKAMALEGHGLAFLPYSSVRKELRARRLVHAADPGVMS